MITDDEYKGPWVQAFELVRSYQHEIGMCLLNIHNAHHKHIDQVVLETEARSTFQEDFKVLENKLRDVGFKNRGDPSNPPEVKKLHLLISDFYKAVNELDIHLLSGAFALPTEVFSCQYRPSIDLFQTFDRKYFDPHSLQRQPRSITSYTDIFTAGQFVALYYKV